MNKQKIFLLFLTLICCANLIRAFALDANDPGEQAKVKETRPFKIGFLQNETESALGLGWYEKVKAALFDEPDVKEALNEGGFSGIQILPSDSFQDMSQRMTHNEFDLAAATAEIYVEQKGDYEPILQQRRKRDIWGRGQVFQKGEIWVNYNSPLFKNSMMSSEEIKSYFEKETMAFVSSHSAPGYIYPLLKIYRELGISQPGGFLFCNSSEEVVKYLVNDLVRIGACENGVAEETLKKSGIADKKDILIKKVFETELMPTDPICILSKYSPEKSRIGKVLSSALKKIYSNAKGEIPRLESSYSDVYKNLREEIEYFSSLRIEKDSK